MDIKIDINKMDQYREIFEALPMHVFWKNTEHVYLGANKKYIASNGFKGEEFIGKTDYELFEEDYANQFVKGDDIALTGQIYEDKAEPSIKNLVGTRNFKVTKIPLYDGEKIVGLLGVVEDLTLEESEVINALNTGYYELQKEILDTMTSSVLVVDAKDRTILFANKIAEKLFNIKANEVINRKCYEALKGRNNPSVDCKLNDIAAREGYIEDKQIVEDKVLRLHIEPIIWRGKEALIRYDEDITEMKKEAEEMSRVRQESEMKNKFLANMSHDIRTPLNAILGLAEIGIKTENVKEKDDVLKNIIGSGKYLTRILNDILDMTKIAAGEVKIEYSNVDLEEFHSEIHKLVKDRAEKKHIEIELNTLNEPKYLRFDKNHVMQIIVNLLNNASKYTPEGGKVVFSNKYITDEFARNCIQYTVSDNGVGMPKEFMERMYLPFERANRIENANIEGTGLGLSIVRYLVDLMNGTITCESVELKGTTFKITIPVQNIEDNVSVEKPGVDNLKQLLSGKKILIVEDVEMNAFIATKLLNYYEVKTEIVRNGAEALNIIKSDRGNEFDLIIMDIKMPVMDGLTASKEIRKFNKHIPIVGLSANAFEEDIQISKAAGMNDHLSKPIDVEKLIGVISKLLI